MLQPRVDFSLRKEIFFVAIASIIAAFVMLVPRQFILDIMLGTQFYITWLAFARIVNSDLYEIGILLHIAVATVIGIVSGLVLYKGKILDISKISNGILYGVISGAIVFLIFFIPVYQFLLAPNMANVLTELDPRMTIVDASHLVGENFEINFIDGLLTHQIWGITLGVLSSSLTTKLGANYRCHRCDIQFSKLDTYEHHVRYVHENPSPSMKNLLILGGGFAGVNVLNRTQEAFEKNVDVNISMVSEDNFFLFTPMLPEISSGMIEPRHIATPVRTFCRRAKFYEAEVEAIDLQRSVVRISRAFDRKKRNLNYDFLVLALGSRNNFFGNKNVETHALTIKTLGDAMGIRNHIINMLETADQEDDKQLRSKFLTFVVVGGGFSGVETVGELNDFVKDCTLKFYRTIDPEELKVILVASGDTILPEVGDELGSYAFTSLKENGVKILTNVKAIDAGEDYVVLSDNSKISCLTLIWAAGTAIDPVVSKLDCHDKTGRVVVDDYLRLTNFPNVYALGDCASISDPQGHPYPPTAQHAIREAAIVSNNLRSSIEGHGQMETFHYKTKGSMAKIGRRAGVALLMGRKVHGFLAWAIWRQYYLSTLPTTEKKIRVAFDWFVDLFFKRDITRLRNLRERN